MRIRVVALDDEPDFIRFARRVTARAIGLVPGSVYGDPVPCALYFLAQDEDGQYSGMIETYFYDQCFERLEEAYGELLDPIRPVSLDLLGNLRSIYVAPGKRGGKLFMALYRAASNLYRQLGARYATCSTSSDNHRMHRVYRMLGGTIMGTFMMGPDSSNVVCLFDLEKLGDRPWDPRSDVTVDVDWDRVRKLRARSWKMPDDYAAVVPSVEA